MNTGTIREFLDHPGYGPAPESDANVRAWLKKYDGKFSHFINGEWIAADPEKRFPTICPATKEVLAEVAQGQRADVDLAMAAADTAGDSWKKLGGYGRARYLYAIARCLQKHARLFAVLESLNNGKSIRETRDIDIPLAIRHFYYHAGWATRHEHEFPDMRAGGVVGQVIPWNFPLLMLAWKIAPAIAVGNTVVLKPAETTPLTALMFAEMLKEEVGLPPGVVNIVTGDGTTGEYIVNHPVPWKIAFTGSTEVGRIIRKATAGTGKRLTLELGGKSPFVVYADADLDSAVEGVVNAIWFNQGQVCCAGSRLLVEESVSARFIEKLKTRMKKLRAGHPLDKAIDMGAINSEAQFCKIRELVELGKQEGGEVWQPENWLPDLVGYYFPPTLIEHVSQSGTLAQEEIFGPVLVCMSFRTPREAVELANNTRYGLAASVWSQDIDRAFYTAKKIKAGTVWINGTNLFDASSGFGGYRESGYGREGGSEGVREYLKESEVREYTHPAAFFMKDVMPEVRDAEVIDRTYRLYIGGKLVRPDGEANFPARGYRGCLLGRLPDANRKDVRNAVEAARNAQEAWADQTADLRAKILYFLAENLQAQKQRFGGYVALESHGSEKAGLAEVEICCSRLFDYAALCDKFEGRVHSVPDRALVAALKEPIGVIGIRGADEYPLLGMIGAIAPAIAMGNTVVYIAGKYSYTAMECIQVLQNSDIPAGVVNIVSAHKPEALAKVLAEHEDVDAMWYFGDAAGSTMAEALSVSNMKRVWTSYGAPLDWLNGGNSAVLKFLYEATQVKNIWSPYGV